MQVLKISVPRRQQIAADDVQTDAAERAWVERIRAGDMHAFEALYRAYWQRLYTFAFRYVRSKEDAEDVTQEVFLRIWRGREHWVPAGAVRNYLYLSVRNAARDMQPNLESAELAAVVEQALAELPPKRSAVCRLRLIDGLSYAEIAHRLAIGEKTVETQLARGLKFLRDRIRQTQ